MQNTLLLGQLVHFLMPLRVGQSQQGDFMSQSGKREGKESCLFDPVMKCGEEKNILSWLCILNKRLNLLHRLWQRVPYPGEVIVVLASAVPPCVPQHIIEFGSQRQFANEIPEGGFVEHVFCHRVTEILSFFESQ